MLICAQRLLMSLEFPVTAYPSPISFHIDYTSSCFRVEATPLIPLSSNSFCPSDLPAHSVFFILFLFFFFREGAVSRHRNPHSLGPVLGHALHAPLSVKRSTCGIAYFRSCVWLCLFVCWPFCVQVPWLLLGLRFSLLFFFCGLYSILFVAFLHAFFAA
jgi:hypothetical protein